LVLITGIYPPFLNFDFLEQKWLGGGLVTDLLHPASAHGYEENFSGQRFTSLDFLYLQHLGSCQSEE
jgi:hypothetical protein